MKSIESSPQAPGHFLDRASPEALFLVSATAQYIGATIAVSLFHRVQPATVAWLRVIGASVTLIALSWHRLRSGPHWSKSERVAAATFGIATALMNLFFYLAIARIPIGKGVAIEFIGPITVAAVQTRTRRNALSLIAAAGGVVLLSGTEIDVKPLGLVFIFSASAMWAVYIVVGARVARLDRGVAGLGVGLAIGAVVITPIGAPTSAPVWTSPGLLLACLAVGVCSNTIGYGIDQHVLRRIPTRRFSVLLAMLPVVAGVVAYVALGQKPSGLDFVGMSLILIGLIIQERDKLRPST